LTTFIIALGIAYSVGSSPWKNHPWLGLAANAVGHGMSVFLFGFMLTECPVSESWAGAFAYSLAVGGVYLATTVPDARGDSETGKCTAAVAWGVRPTIITAALLVLAAIGIAAWIGDRYLAIAGIVAFPFFLRPFFRPASAAAAAKAAVGALSLAAVVAYPPYVLILAAGLVATRLFFRWRFGVSYPTLG
jgi:hypothetical protein